MTDEEKKKVVERARELYERDSDDNIEIDEDPQVSEGEEYHWVQAWVCVPAFGRKT